MCGEGVRGECEVGLGGCEDGLNPLTPLKFLSSRPYPRPSHRAMSHAPSILSYPNLSYLLVAAFAGARLLENSLALDCPTQSRIQKTLAVDCGRYYTPALPGLCPVL